MKLELQEEISDRLYQGASLLPGYGLYHTANWHRLLAEAFSWTVAAAVAWDGERLAGFLPFVRKRRFLDRATVCLPLSHLVGPVVDPQHPALADELCRLVGSLEVHSAIAGEGMPTNDLVETVATFDGPRDPEAFRASLSNNVRRNLRSAEKFGVTVEVGASEDLFAAYADLQTMTRRKQGSPDYPARFFPAMGRLLGPAGLARVHLAMLDGRPAAGVVSLNDPDGARYYYGYGGSRTDPDVLQKRVNQAAMWSAIAQACRAGAKEFTFGSSPLHQEDLWRYKERFGGESRPLPWTFYGRSTPGMSMDGLLTRIGSRVLKSTPLPLFRSLSPLLLREVL